jgi:hypothetical protein
MHQFLGFCEVLRGLLRRARDPFVRSESSGVLRTLFGVEPACFSALGLRGLLWPRTDQFWDLRHHCS